MSKFDNKYKKLFDNYFNRQEKSYIEVFGYGPTMPYDENIDSDFYTSKPNDDNEAEWKPIKISNVNWNKVESSLGIVLNDEIKAFYGTYKFLDLSGKIDDYEYNIINFGVDCELEDDIINRYYKNGFQELQLFYIGYIESETKLFYSNVNGKMYKHDEDLGINIEEFEYSLSEILEKISGF